MPILLLCDPVSLKDRLWFEEYFSGSWLVPQVQFFPFYDCIIGKVSINWAIPVQDFVTSFSFKVSNATR